MSSVEVSRINTNGKYPISKIADWFLSKDSMDHRKLQKLCYYAEAWYVVFENQKLYSDTKFEGWVHGPVSPRLYGKYRDYGFVNISKNSNKVVLDDRSEEILNWVYSIYSNFDGYQLSDITHKELPWIESRQGLDEFENGNTPLELNTIREYYTDYLNEHLV